VAGSLLGVGVAAAWAAGPAVAPRAGPGRAPAPLVLRVDEARGGPPVGWSCADAKAGAAAERLGAPPEVDVPVEGGALRGALPPPPLRENSLASVAPAAAPAPAAPDLWLTKADLSNGRLDAPAAVAPQPLEGSPAALGALAAAFSRAERGGRLRVSVFGASHTEGDVWTGALRRMLQDRYGDLGHGFVVPAAPVSGYRGQDVNLCASEGWRGDWAGRKGGRADGRFALSGATVASAHPADFGWVETTHENPHGRRVSRFDVFAVGQPGGGALLLTVDDAAPRAVQTAGEGLVWVRVEVPDGPHRLTVQPLGDGEVRLLGVSAERGGAGALVDAIGLRGRQARSWLDWSPALRDAALYALDPDVAVLAFGVNEAADADYDPARHAAELDRVLSVLRGVLPETACVLVGPTDRVVETGRPPRYRVVANTARVTAVQRAAARKHGCAFWDWQAAMGGPGAMLAWRHAAPPLANPDLIHLSTAGYERSARFFADALADAAGIPPFPIP
jgi:lysophospholipase L1-like esterase